jgi:hypothetical protein
MVRDILDLIKMRGGILPPREKLGCFYPGICISVVMVLGSLHLPGLEELVRMCNWSGL